MLYIFVLNIYVYDVYFIKENCGIMFCIND